MACAGFFLLHSPGNFAVPVRECLKLSEDFQARLPSRSALRKQYRAALRSAVLSVPGVAGFDVPLLKRLRGDSGLWIRDARGGVHVRLRLKLRAGHSAAAVAQRLRECLMPPPHEVIHLDIYFGRIVKARGAE